VKCQKVIEETRRIMALLGIEGERLRLKWISASEGAAFADEIRSFTQRLRELGKLGLGAPAAKGDQPVAMPGQPAAAAAS
jgi:coenzyme F420-reducing hydrogenase delta subunit